MLFCPLHLRRSLDYIEDSEKDTPRKPGHEPGFAVSGPMGKLKTLAPRIGSLAPRIGRAPGDEKARLKERDHNVEWRSWYGTERWKKLRHQVWARDHYRCQKTGMLCIGKYPADNSPVADHKIPHRGDPVLFWDPENIETVSKAYHDSEKQKQERAQSR